MRFLMASLAAGAFFGLFAPAASAQGVSSTSCSSADPTALTAEGDRYFDGRESDKAYACYQKADELQHTVARRIFMSRALGQGKQYVRARRLVKGILADPSATPDEAREARQDLDALSALIPTVRIVAPAPVAANLKVTLDENWVSASDIAGAMAVDPGDHAIVAEALGYATTRQTFHVEAREHKEITLSMTPAQQEPMAPAPLRPARALEPGSTTAPLAPLAPLGPSKRNWTVPVVFGAACGAGIVTGAVAGAVSLAKTSSLRDSCHGTTCPAQFQSDLNAAKTAATVSDWGFSLAGGLALAAGISAVIVAAKGTSRDDKKTSSQTILVGAGLRSMTLSVSF
jgi:hypothetical protein